MLSKPRKFQELENLEGCLIDTIPKFVTNSVRSSREISEERVLNEELREKWFYTNNYGLYTNENSHQSLYIGENSPIFDINIFESACKQLKSSGNYYPSAEITEYYKENANLKLNLNKFAQDEQEDVFSILVKSAPKQLVNVIYGEGKKILPSGARIYLLSPKGFLKHLNGNSSLLRTCFLSNWYSNMVFYIDSTGTNNYSLRGIMAPTK